MSDNLVDTVQILDNKKEFEKTTSDTQRQLYEYIIDGKVEEFKQLLTQQLSIKPDEGVDQIFLDKESQATLTHKAARYNQVEILDFLVSKGASLESTDFLESTPIMYASASGSTKACHFLLSKGASVNAKDKYQMSPLILAMKNNHIETASVLLLSGADIHVKGPRGNSALHQACEEGNQEKVKFLLENGAIITRTNQKSQNCLFSCLKHQPVLSLLVDGLANSTGGVKSVYRQLLSRDDQTRTVMHHCVENDYKASLAYLLQYLSSNKATLKEFVNDKEQLFGNTPLHLAATANKVDIARLLLETKEIDIDAQNNAGNTALHVAIANNNQMMAQFIYHVGKASTKVKNNAKITPSQLAKDKKVEIKKFTHAADMGITDVSLTQTRKSIWNIFNK